jgi:hypothetical protein
MSDDLEKLYEDFQTESEPEPTIPEWAIEADRRTKALIEKGFVVSTIPPITQRGLIGLKLTTFKTKKTGRGLRRKPVTKCFYTAVNGSPEQISSILLDQAEEYVRVSE